MNEEPITTRADFQAPPATGRMRLLGFVLVVVGLGIVGCVGWAWQTAYQSIDLCRVTFHAYVVAYAFYLSITLVCFLRPAAPLEPGAGWSVTLRRPAEALAGNMGLMGILAIPLFIALGGQRPWAWWCELAELRCPLQAWCCAEGSGGPLGRLLRHLGRAGVVFPQPLEPPGCRPRSALELCMERLSAPGMIVLAVTATFAAIDLLMSLNGHCRPSTIFGVYFFIGSVLAGLAALALLARWLTTNDQRPTTNDQRPTTNDSRPRCRCRAQAAGAGLEIEA